VSETIDFRAVRDHFGLSQTAAVEKDWHVMRALRAITSVDANPFRLVLAGGTCLARAHRLVRRMSEDVDFKVVPLDNAPTSSNQRRRQLGDLRNRITASLQAAGFQIDPGDTTQLLSRDANEYTVYHLNYAEPGDVGTQLRPTIQIELTRAALRLPSVRLPVASFVAEASGHDPEISAIDCVSVTETAAEKLVSLTRRSAMELAGLSRGHDLSLVRHIYDLHMIRDHIDLGSAAELARQIARQDAAEFRNQYPAYHADIPAETHKGIDVWTREPAGRDLYDNFVAAMVYGEQVNFSTAMATSVAMVDAAWPLTLRS
jgi:predicted nucleotidyltransferase component of viral defense system